MPKSNMSDDEIKQLLSQIRDWMSKSDEQAAEQVTLKRGGKAKKKKQRAKRVFYGNGGYSGGTSTRSGTGGGGTSVARTISNTINRAVGSQAPSQQSSWAGKLDNALGRMGFSSYSPHGHAGENGSRDSGNRGIARAQQVAAPQAAVNRFQMPALPAYQNIQQMPQQWSQAPVTPNPSIANFNASQGFGNASPPPMMGNASPLQMPQASPFYGQPRSQGGRTDSVSSALRMIKNKLL